ncbi:hypothetical protein Clacol_007853 [Clathrus columnatus]|uniref:Uncharacterized protein n=1 Tax=Clathrus columnatus TaxID=1419009 RepID=A0AAV5AIL0_9AGAM|nr:hypothetical protein Clacol_007853 [Clathrus columnatus]
MSSTANAEPIIPSSFPKLPLGTSLAGNLEATFGVVIIAIIISAFLDGWTDLVGHVFSAGGGIQILTNILFVEQFPGPGPVCLYNGFRLFVSLAFLVSWKKEKTEPSLGWYLVRNWGNVDALQIVRPTFGIFVIFGSLAVFIVQCLFLERIWGLDKKYRYYIIPLSILICIELSFAMIGASLGVHVEQFSSIPSRGFDGAVVGIWLGAGVLADNPYQTNGFSNLSTRLIVYSVNTCLLTRRASIWSEEAAANLSGIIIQTEQTTDVVGRATVYVPGQRSTAMVRMGMDKDSTTASMDTEPKPSVSERNWDFEMYPGGGKDTTVDIVPDRS